MTYAAFLEALAKTPRDWRVEKNGAIRRTGLWHTCCPLQEISNGSGRGDFFGVIGAVAAVFGSHASPIGWAIMYAADKGLEHDSAVRADLLRACGLEEQR